MLDTKKHLPGYGIQSAWESSEIIVSDAIQDPDGLGWKLSRIDFEKDLIRAALGKGVWFCEDKVKSLKPNCEQKNSWELTFSDKTIQASVVIDASGRSAKFARQIDGVQPIPLEPQDRMIAHYTWATPDPGRPDDRTLIESTDEGWWYSAFLKNRTRVFSFHTNQKTASRQKAFFNALQKTRHIRELALDCYFNDNFYTNQAGSSRLNTPAGPEWFAAGDAAMAFDPISSQGIFNALYLGMKAGDAAADQLKGNLEKTKKYVDRCQTIWKHYLSHRELYYSVKRPANFGGL